MKKNCALFINIPPRRPTSGPPASCAPWFSTISDTSQHGTRSRFSVFLQGFLTARTFVHEKWTGRPEDGYDIALVLVNGQSKHPPAGMALALKPSFSTDKVVALGWGKDKTGKMVKDLQQTTSVEVIQNRFCDDEDYWPSLKESMICAFGIESNQNLCEGMAHHCWALTKAGCSQSSDLFSHPESVCCFHFTIAVRENDFPAHQNWAAKTPHLYRGQNRATILDFSTQAIHRPSPHVFHL